MSAPNSSKEVVNVQFDILAGKEVSVLNELLGLYGHPDDPDEIAELTLRDSDGHEITVEIEEITTLEEDPVTGSTHFIGTMVGGGTISGHVRPGPATKAVVGRASMSIKIDA